MAKKKDRVKVVKPAKPIAPPRRRPEGVPHSEPWLERKAAGERARMAIPLEAHEVFAPTSLRADPVELLSRQNPSRVSELLPIRYGRMVASPFAFYRGAALVMAADLATTENSGIRAQLCGDAHVSNFGFYASAERNLVFDINDFDETNPGPFEWDVKRLAASVEIACRSQSFPTKKTRAIVLSAVRSYRESMHQFSTMPNQSVWYARLDAEDILNEIRKDIPSRARKAEALLAQARTKDSMQAFRKLTHLVDGQPRIISDPPLIVPVEELFSGHNGDVLLNEMAELLAAYRSTLASDRKHLFDQYTFVHLARKVVGVGSVGTRAWILLFEGPDNHDPLFLQAKQAQTSVLEQYVGVSEYSNHGERVVAGQRLMQASSDIFLGWQRTLGVDGVERDYYVRQLRDWKGSVDVEGAAPEGMAMYARMCGWTLARAHARSGDRVAIASYLGESPAFDEAIATFSASYADQNDKDYAALRAAIDDGRVPATEGL